MLDEQIDATANWARQVFTPRNPERNRDKAIVVYLDSEFNLSRTRRKPSGKYMTYWHKHPFLSYCLRWGIQTGRLGPILSEGEIDRFNLERLLGWILDCLRKWRAPVKKRVCIVAHWAISEIRFARGIEEEDIFAPTTNFFHGHIKYAGVDWWIKDSFGLFATSLEKLTTDTPIPKVKVTREERADPYKFLTKNRKRFWAYAEGDVRSLQWATEHWRAKIWHWYGIDVLRCLTTATIGKRIFQTRYQGDKPLEPYVREVVTIKSGKPKTEYSFNSQFREIRRLAMQCYWGGRRETFVRGVIRGTVRHYDFVKLYMTSAALCPVPSPRSEFPAITGLQDLDNPGWVHIKHFRFKPDTHVPLLPVFDRRFRKLVYPLEGESYCTTFEAREARDAGAELDGISGYSFTEPYDDRVSRFMQDLLQQCSRYRGKFGEKFFKSIGVAFVGKLVEHRLAERHETYGRPETYTPGTAFSPMLASLILGYARATESAVLATAKTPLYCHTDSITAADCEPDLNHPQIRRMEEMSGGLELKWTAERFWSPRAAVYWAKRTDGKYEGAHHAIHVEDEDWYKGIEVGLNEANSKERWPKLPLSGFFFIKYKPASWNDHVKRGLPLTTEIEQISTTDFHWDDKRELLQEDCNVMGLANRTRPWKNIETLIENVPVRRQIWKRRGRKETIGERLGRQTGKRGRPPVVTAKDLAEMKRLFASGLSRHEISRRFKDRYGRRTIYRRLR